MLYNEHVVKSNKKLLFTLLILQITKLVIGTNWFTYSKFIKIFFLQILDFKYGISNSKLSCETLYKQKLFDLKSITN